MLAFRRQHHQEVATVLGDLDATERRITELYTKAAEELGSDKAPVRLAGLYALERLAQANPDHRQTVLNVICAYLRMPFEPPPPPGQPRRLQRRLNRPTAEPLPAASRSRPSLAEELLVRTTAQEIITRHLFTDELDTSWPRKPVPSASSFWPGMELDLAGAVLVDFDLHGKVDVANFTGARFIGGANFAHAEFDGHVYFRDARFEGGSGHFYGAWFGYRAVFVDADFGDHEAVFEAATFAGMTFFRGARFGGGVSLRGARALAEFNTSWGSMRNWPRGWTERPLTPDEQITAEGRWEQPGKQAPATSKWNVLVSDGKDLATE
jgi:hypothetical protein